jgi:hypothetical protein
MTIRRLFALLLVLAVAALLAAPALAQTVQATAYGVVADPAVDNSAAVERAAAAAIALPGDEPAVVLPCGVVGYTALDLPAANLTLAGCGGTLTRMEPDAGGGPPFPRVLADCRTTLRVVDSWAPAYLAGLARPSRIQPRPPNRRTVYFGVGDWNTGRRGYEMAHDEAGNVALGRHSFRLQDLCLDGNEASAVAAWRTASPAWLEENLRNGAAHTGLAAGAEGGTYWCLDPPRVVDFGPWTYVAPGLQPGLTAEVSGVTVTGYTAVGLLGGGNCTRGLLTNSRVERSAYNHAAYNFEGGGENPDLDLGPYEAWGGYDAVTFAGTSWTEIVTSNYLVGRGLRVEAAPSANPFGRDPAELFNPRNGTPVVYGLALDAPFGAAGMPRHLANGPVDVRPLPAGYAPPPRRPSYVAAPGPAPPAPSAPPPPVVTPPPVEPPPSGPVITYERETRTTVYCRKVIDGRRSTLVAGSFCAPRPATAR